MMLRSSRFVRAALASRVVAVTPRVTASYSTSAMFCYQVSLRGRALGECRCSFLTNHAPQCEQTDKGTGCTVVGQCGKSPVVSREQDLVMHALKGIAQYTSRAAALGASDAAIDRFSIDAAFATLTNVNFDEARFVTYLKEADEMIVKAAKLYSNACVAKGVPVEKLSGAATWRLKSTSASDMAEEGRNVAGDILDRKAAYGPDVVGMQEMILYGLKGAAAYIDHARRLGKESAEGERGALASSVVDTEFVVVRQCMASCATRWRSWATTRTRPSPSWSTRP